MNRGIIAIVFFLAGILCAPYVTVSAENRLALSAEQFNSTERVPFESIHVYPNEVRIEDEGIRYARVISNSMAPIITDKSVVFEKAPTAIEDIHIGDVISFYEPTHYAIVLHAVIDIVYQNGKQFFKTKGVANPTEDPWLVPFENVKGIMVGTFK